jgi:hypothetical protein
LHFFIGGVSFFCSCFFSEAKHNLGFGAGIPFMMFALQLLSNVGGYAENAKYFTFFTLFDPDGLIAGESGAIVGIIILFAGAVLLFGGAVMYALTWLVAVFSWFCSGLLPDELMKYATYLYGAALAIYGGKSAYENKTKIECSYDAQSEKHEDQHYP